ncbi:MAG: hypothetical protein HWN68_07610 [Desulfobacterales bacterium]|nr:hypothetical protein [Desulfobacterales bacterium]
MHNDYEAMRGRITKYFAKVTNTQLKKDLEKASYSFYRNIKTSVLDALVLEDQFVVAIAKPKLELSFWDLGYEELSVADSYEFSYSLAA